MSGTGRPIETAPLLCDYNAKFNAGCPKTLRMFRKEMQRK